MLKENNKMINEVKSKLSKENNNSIVYDYWNI